MPDHRPSLTRPPTVEDQLFTEGYGFNFFQAVRILERLQPNRRPVGRAGPARAEAVRFHAHLSLAFPPSVIYDVEKPSLAKPVPDMIVTFMGLTGPSGALPHHYTELLLRLDRDASDAERYALRAWLDLFNHRLISLFYRAWEKYRFFIPYERGEFAAAEQDPFTRSLFSLIGLGTPPLHNRLRISTREHADDLAGERVLAGIDDLALLFFSGTLAHRPRCAAALEAMLCDYFQLPVEVQQFQGQWLLLEEANQSRLGGKAANNQPGMSLVAGQRVWDVQGKIRIRVGPLCYADFIEFLPDRTPVPERKAFFLLCHLVRLYLGPELDFEIQLVLQAEDVPACRMVEGQAGWPRLGWDTWLCSLPVSSAADDAVFEGEEVRWLGAGNESAA